MATDALAKYKALMTKQPQPFEDSLIILLGAPSSGKTVLACTASEQCPPELPAKVMTTLEDVAFIPVEAGALDSLRGLRLGVKHVVPYSAILADVKNPVVALAHAIDIAKTTGANKLVVDSVSMFDNQMQAYLNTDEGKLIWSGDKFSLFRWSLAGHNVALSKIQEFQGLKIACFHPQAVMEDLDSKGQEKSATAQAMDKAMERRDKAVGSIAQADLVLGVTGKAREIWPKPASLILGLQQVKQANGGYVREVLTRFDEKSGLAIKTRFEGILDAKEVPHLGRIISKVRAFK